MLARGAKGPEVVALQQRLTALGWTGIAPDGDWGMVTDAALRRQQRAMGLTPDGVLGPATQGRLATASPSPTPQRPILVRSPLQYRTQRDNVHAPSSTCNVTSYAMVLSVLGITDPPGKQLEDALYEAIVSPEGQAYARQHFPWAVGTTSLWTVHGMLVWAASRYKVRAEFATNRRWADIVRELERGRPVVFSGKFTSSGHIVMLNGIADARTFIVQDPWGDWNRGYRETNGASRVYTQEALSQITGPDGSLWAHFFPA